MLSAGKLQLDQEKGLGTAQHAVLKIAHVPVFYFPWFRFPINDQRMSGVLAPTFSHSDNQGDSFSLPIYWNQAQHYDMTITPYWYSKRGVQVNTENRYLLDRHHGQLDLSWLDDDEYGEERWYSRWQHQSDIGLGINTTILAQRVSDSDFLQDFDQLDTVNEVDYLKSALSFTGELKDWNAQLLFEEYQVIDENKSISARPYERLPRFTLQRPLSAYASSSLHMSWENEWVRFDKDDSITGDRLHIAPQIHFPIEQDAFFIKPSLQLDYRRYELDNNSDDVNNISQSIPLFSVDSGLIFERLAGTSDNWIQTLEPRLYLLYVPFEEQSDIPDFDTALLADSYDNLFRNNRFSGKDRIGDSKQLSLGLTTRLLHNNSGAELFRASIGQAFYAQDRRVSLNNTVDERKKSNLIGVLNYKPLPEWDIQLNSVYDQQDADSRQTDIIFRRHYQQQVFNLEYHLRRNAAGEDTLEQSTLSFVYPLSTSWTSFAKRQHSLRLDKPVQNLFGLAYENCCWGFTALYEESSDDDFEETDRAVYFQLTLKGLASSGRDIDSILEDGILGYQPAF